MRQLTTLTLIGAAAALTLSATAASAQMYDGRTAYRQDAGATVNQRLWQLDRRIDRGIRQGDLTQREARQAQGALRQIAHRQQMYRTGGYTRWELADLDRRMDQLAMQVRFDRHDDQYRRNDQYGSGYGYQRR